MALTRSYIIPIEDLTLAERQSRREKVAEALVANAELRSIAPTSDLVIRDTLPDTDLGLANTRDWVIAGPGVAGVELSYINRQIARDTLVEFYGCAINSPNPSLSVMRIVKSTSDVRAVVQLEQLESRLVPAGLLSAPVIFLDSSTAQVLVTPKLAFGTNGQRLVMYAMTAEVIGSTVSRPAA